MASHPMNLDAIAENCITMYLRQRREEREWNESPPVLADIISAQAAAHEVDRAALAARVRAEWARRRPAET
jgi:hypothetical protein